MKKLNVLIIFILIFNINTYSHEIKNKEVENQILSSGVEHISEKRYTEDGLIEFDILKISLKNDAIEFKQILPKEFGYKYKLTDMAKEENIFAAINGDFFGMKVDPTDFLGVTVEDGRFISTTNNLNNSANKYASFYIENNIPFIKYLKPNIKFLNNGKENIELRAMNKLAYFDDRGVYLDKDIISTTKEIDENHGNLDKIIVENGRIVRITNEEVKLPENGYIIVSKNINKNLFNIGDFAQVEKDLGFDYKNIKTAVSGATKIIENGKKVTELGMLPKGRHPRTVIGFDKDNENVYFVTVDGRRESIGASNDDIAQILLDYDIYEAMHLDGGGSSTMILKNGERYDILNKLSGYVERKIANGFGFVINSGDLKNVKIKSKDFYVGVENNLKIYGLDKNNNYISLEDDFDIKVLSNSAEIKDNKFIPYEKGKYKIRVKYKNRSYYFDIEVKSGIKEIFVKEDNLNLMRKQEYDLEVYGKLETGDEIKIDNNLLEVKSKNRNLYIRDGVVKTPNKNVEDTINIRYDNLETKLNIKVGFDKSLITNFDERPLVNVKTYKPGTKVKIGYSNKDSVGVRSVKLDYSFTKNGNTQAAYINFINPLEIKGEPNYISIDLYGDNSNNIVRGKVLDKNNNLRIITFTKDVDFKGWKTLKAEVEDDTLFPIKLKNIYIMANDINDEDTHTIYLDNINSLE